MCDSIFVFKPILTMFLVLKYMYDTRQEPSHIYNDRKCKNKIQETH